MPDSKKNKPLDAKIKKELDDLEDKLAASFQQVKEKVKRERHPDIKPFEDKLDDEVKDVVAEIKTVLKKNTSKLHKALNIDRPDRPFSYIENWFKEPAIASFAPSSKVLQRKVIKELDLSRAKVVVEYGAAEGVLTRPMLEAMPRDSKLVAFELHDKFYEALAEIDDPRLIPVHGNVLDVDKVLRDHGLDGADRVTSGIPFSFLNPRQRHALLTKTYEMLPIGGRFVPYQVTPHLVPLLKDYFHDVDVDWVVRNLPPNFVFTCVKTREEYPE